MGVRARNPRLPSTSTGRAVTLPVGLDRRDPSVVGPRQQVLTQQQIPHERVGLRERVRQRSTRPLAEDVRGDGQRRTPLVDLSSEVRPVFRVCRPSDLLARETVSIERRENQNTNLTPTLALRDPPKSRLRKSR